MNHSAYVSVHAKLRRDFGPATMYQCVECCGPADEWAYVGEGMGSRDLSLYQPMCRPCHRMMDGNHNRDKTRCPQGHEYTETNTYIYRDGSRKCRACRRK